MNGTKVIVSKHMALSKVKILSYIIQAATPSDASEKRNFQQTSKINTKNLGEEANRMMGLASVLDRITSANTFLKDPGEVSES